MKTSKSMRLARSFRKAGVALVRLDHQLVLRATLA